VLIHGFFSTATDNRVRCGHAARIAARGYRVVMPDLRGHGDSAKPHDAAAYPPDVLADDDLALIEQLGLIDYDLGGYSLGGRTTVRMLARGATAGRAIVAGTGLEEVLHAAGRGSRLRHILSNPGSFDPGSADLEGRRS
jgi:pimeloyl-ACP methyl ester carboxylesterase